MGLDKDGDNLVFPLDQPSDEGIQDDGINHRYLTEDVGGCKIYHDIGAIHYFNY